ncbi:S1 RNA-binding domain-containing protein [Maledivibacter halophilus]|uniref:S1 RNA binding domain protein n=1 Tax=Maledivibacter halophilus TaxID=36842 RepID=A0A1T5MSE5_9FIRM|nr:S1 RNA-binding domain-containing protein [Maledivibacter halophilus]SKC91146.1 S1 RNA binding domain protein [Maledivibacter halophilus]
MPLEIGKVVEGTVTGITNFGAFIQLPDGSTGLCHISEIADEYVKNVKDYLKEKQVVKVKIIEMSGNGKVSLSIRKACDKKPSKPEKRTESPKVDRKPSYSKPNYSKPSYSKPNKAQGSFEDMLSKYLKDSDEKLKAMKKNANNRRGNGFNRNG